MLLYIFLYGFLDVTIAFHQTDYEIINHRMDLVSYNRKYTRSTSADLVPFNRTIRALNASFDLLRDLTEHPVEMSIRAQKMSMNAYREFPLQLDLNYCKMRIENSFGINDIAKCSNIPPCPIKKGHYYINNYRPDESQFPPRAMIGEYKLIVKISYTDEALAEVHWYAAIKAIEKLRVQRS